MSKTLITYPGFSVFVIFFYINKRCFVTFLIFSFIFGLVGKMVQVRLVGDLKKED